jgi:hypothetical protein
MKNIWCKIGLHRWMEIGIQLGIDSHATVHECLRCQVREVRYVYSSPDSPWLIQHERVRHDPPEGGWGEFGNSPIC